MMMLEGIRIIELEGLGPGPFAGMLLADLGADVIVVHRRDGKRAPGLPERSLIDRGKRSIALDLKDRDDHATLLRLLETADAMIEGFRPGVLERLGLAPTVLHGVNPGLVIGRMTGWGQTGPLAAAAGHDLNYVAMSGAAAFSSLPGDAPFPPPSLLGDVGGGALYLVAGLLAGLLRVRGGGPGTVVDAAITDGSAHMLALLMSVQVPGQAMARGTMLLSGPHWSRVYLCADGGYLSVQCLEPQFYALFLDRLGLSGDPAFSDQFDAGQWPQQVATLARLFLTRPRDDWAAEFLGSDACVAPVLSPQEAAQHPLIAPRGIWLQAEGGLQPAPAPRFVGETAPRPRPAPSRGADARAILAELDARPSRRATEGPCHV